MCGKWIVVLMIALSPCFLLAGEENEVIETLTNYAAAMQNMSISEMEKYLDTSEAFTIFEGGLINRGWADFRYFFREVLLIVSSSLGKHDLTWIPGLCWVVKHVRSTEHA